MFLPIFIAALPLCLFLLASLLGYGAFSLSSFLPILPLLSVLAMDVSVPYFETISHLPQATCNSSHTGLRKTLSDESPYVRKIPAICVALLVMNVACFVHMNAPVNDSGSSHWQVITGLDVSGGGKVAGVNPLTRAPSSVAPSMSTRKCRITGTRS